MTVAVRPYAGEMANTAFRLEPADERTHAPDDVAHFNESIYCNGFDPVRRAGGWMRLGNRVNEGYAELSVCLYLPGGRLACAFRRPPITSNDAFDAGGLRAETVEPFVRQEWRYEGELLLLDDPDALRDPKAMMATAPRVDGSVTLTATGISKVHGGEPEDGGGSMYGLEFSRGHFNQHVRSVGEIVVGDERIELDGFGWRDHSWGPRLWQNISWYRLFILNFGPDRGAMLLKIADPSGATRRVGVILVDGAYEEIEDMDLITRWSPRRDPQAWTLSFRTARRSGVIEGRVLTLAPLRNRREIDGELVVSRVAEGFTEVTWDDRTGLGMTEYIERLDADGVPVGWPL